jgi:hypothetical protein
MEGTACYPPLTTGCSQAGLVGPVFDYDHGPTGGCSITGGSVYRGSRLPILAGRYFYADFCKGWVRSFRYVNGVVQDQYDHTADLFGTTLGNIDSFGEDTRGELYVVLRAGARGSSVYRIAPGP